MMGFQKIVKEIRPLIQDWESWLSELPEDIISNRHNSQQRTIRQIIGHMVDSASNNTHRIVHLQYGPSPCRFPDYANLGNNDRWIAIQNYQTENWLHLLQLWKYAHLHFLHVMQQVDREKLRNIWISALDERITLEAMVIDFHRHFKMHLGEIDELLWDDKI